MNEDAKMEINLLWAVVEVQNAKINSLQEQIREVGRCLELQQKTR